MALYMNKEKLENLKVIKQIDPEEGKNLILKGDIWYLFGVKIIIPK